MLKAKAVKNYIGILKFNYKVMQLKKMLYPDLAKEIDQEVEWIYNVLKVENMLK